MIPERQSPERQSMDVDVVCVGFGPATAGFLTTLEKTPNLESAACPGMPLQVICYERADDVGFGVSGVVTQARGIRASIPDLNPAEIPMATPVTGEKLVYLLDPVGASRRSLPLKAADALLKTLGIPRESGVELPYAPPFLRKDGGIVMSLGQFMQFVGGRLMASGSAQIWPGMPVEQALIEDGCVRGVRLADQGVSSSGEPESGFVPGMDIHAALTVVGDGPVGPVGRQLDQVFGMPEGNHHREWAVGMKMVVDLPPDVDLKPGVVFHTFGYPEPEIFGFLYVHPERVATVGIFVPSWFRSPVRTSYRYLQHYIQHPYLWRYLRGGKLRSWGAKSLQESGRRGEPFLAGNGYARIGEGSGSTNVLSGSGVDEAWTTGAQLAEGLVELLQAGKPLTRENLEQAYVARRRASWVEAEGRIAEKARDGFHHGILRGLAGMAIAGFTKGKLAIAGEPKPVQSFSDYYRGKLSPEEVERITAECRAKGTSCHDALMDRCGWPAIPYDGELLVSQQDALLMGGKVQAPAGFADHVRFVDPAVCSHCASQLCVEICSGQALTATAGGGVPAFDREKCVHCGACQWNCESGNLVFQAGAGGLHSSEN
jgi:electron-transferring-flavoprotein dehydrogenase